MKKITSLFQRNYGGDRQVRDEIVPGAEWVAAGEGVATRKFDGTCCRIRDSKLLKRYDAKHGKTPPEGFEPSQDPDPITGHWPGWIAVGDGPEDQWHREAFGLILAHVEATAPFSDGIFELCGPKIQGNPEGFGQHVLVSLHTDDRIEDFVSQPPRDFAGLKEFLATAAIEGIVWHHSDGRMVKIKAKDFGIKRVAESC